LTESGCSNFNNPRAEPCTRILGIVAPEQGEIGPDLFHAACRLGPEGLVSKRRDWPYQAGRSKHWVKVKNRKHPAMSRVLESFA
jgi:bifunctional non-homologous end joining protein LigD